MRTLISVLVSCLAVSAVSAQPVDHAIARCTMLPVPLGFNATDWQFERCAPDIETSELWPLDRSDSVGGELNGFAVRRTTGRGSLVYVVDTGILQRHDEFRREDGSDNVIGGFDAHQAAGNRSPCPDFALEPCYFGPGDRLRHGHGTAVASTVAGRTVGIAPDAMLYSATIYPTPVPREPLMWKTVLDHIMQHAWDPSAPAFETAIVTISVPATPQPANPLYQEVVEKRRRMTVGVDRDGNEDPNGKKFLFTVAAGNLVPIPGFNACGTFPAILGTELDGVVTVGGITRDNVWWSGSCSGSTVEVVAPAAEPVLASISALHHYRRGSEVSGTSFAAPYVAGIAARLLELDPSRTPAELEALLKASPSHAADSGLPVPVLTVGEEMRKQR